MKIVRELDNLKWSDFVFSHPDGNIFQSPEMYDVYRNTKNYKPILVALLDDRDEVLGILLAVVQGEDGFVPRGLTARAVVWGGPLVRNNDPDVISTLLLNYDNIVKSEALYTEFRNLWDVSPYYGSFEAQGYRVSAHLNFLVDLAKGKDALFSKLSSSKRRQVRRGLERAEISIAANEDDIVEYYRILADYYSAVVKKPLPPLSFFTSFHRILSARKSGITFLVRSNGKIIGGIMCPISRSCSRNVIYELYVAGSREHDSIYPGVLATWAPIEWGAENGCDFFDFMGAGKPDVDYGVREFKSKFGGELVSYGRLRKIHRPILNGISQAGFRLWRVLH
jgi:serine/alanine adding enzyme